MTKKISVISLISVITFTALNFATSQFHNAYDDESRIGWPFIFFTADPEKQIDASRSFFFLNFLLDWLICILISVTLVYLFSSDKKVKNSHHRHHHGDEQLIS
jgi:hypothetical protein